MSELADHLAKGFLMQNFSASYFQRLVPYQPVYARTRKRVLAIRRRLKIARLVICAALSVRACRFSAVTRISFSSTVSALQYQHLFGMQLSRELSADRDKLSLLDTGFSELENNIDCFSCRLHYLKQRFKLRKVVIQRSYSYNRIQLHNGLVLT